MFDPMTDQPLDLEAAERRIYAPDVPYTHIVLREVPLLLAEIRRLRTVERARKHETVELPGGTL